MRAIPRRCAAPISLGTKPRIDAFPAAAKPPLGLLRKPFPTLCPRAAFCYMRPFRRALGSVRAMQVTERVKKILEAYESDNPGTKANLARILMQGKLGGTGKLVILPVDQGFEHGPARSFAPNPPAYDPHYHFQLAIDAGLSAYAAPLGFIEAGADTFAGQIPTILKV